MTSKFCCGVALGDVDLEKKIKKKTPTMMSMMAMLKTKNFIVFIFLLLICKNEYRIIISYLLLTKHLRDSSVWKIERCASRSYEVTRGVTKAPRR